MKRRRSGERLLMGTVQWVLGRLWIGRSNTRGIVERLHEILVCALVIASSLVLRVCDHRGVVVLGRKRALVCDSGSHTKTT